MSLDRLIYNAIKRGNIAISNLGDNVPLNFGSSKDVAVEWTGSLLTVIPLVDDTGAINIGNGTKDIDLKIYLGTTSNWAKFDVGNKNFETDGLRLKFHQHLAAAGIEYHAEFKGEFLGTSGTMDGIAAHYHMGASGTGVMRAVIGVAYLDAGITLSGTEADANWVSGGLFAADVAATAVLNGTGVIFNALCGKVSSAITSTMTACKHASALYGIAAMLTKPVSGECSILHLSQEAGATCINQAIYLEGGATIDAFATIDVAASGKAVETCTSAMSTNATSHALHVKIGAADGYIPVYDNNTWS